MEETEVVNDMPHSIEKAMDGRNRVMKFHQS